MRQIDNIASSIADYAFKTNASVMGQNLFKPSYISGLGKYLVKEDGITPLKSNYFDTTNSELTSVGYGIGRMIENNNTILVVKQQDFLFLAIDQLINSLVNIIDIPSRDLGTFTIICMISDWPYEGTQARSNHISLFESLCNHLRTYYCHDEKIFEHTLNQSNKGVRIIFLSSEYTYERTPAKYKWQDFSNNIVATSIEDKTPIVNILVGFVPRRELRTCSNNAVAIIEIGSKDLLISIINAIEKYWETKNVTVNFIEASTSKTSASYELAWKLSKSISLFKHISVRTLPVGTRENIALINQNTSEQ